MSDSMVDWKLAAKVAGKVAPAGPKLRPEQMRAAVESLRYAAVASVDHVYRITGLEVAANLHDSEILVLDRAGWSLANSLTFELMIEPLAASSMGRRFERLSALERAVVRAGGATEVGAVLSFLSTRVLGQYDPYAALVPGGPAGGRLMLVAPNILAVEEELKVEPEDFRLWVCLHEQTHRVQFAAAPWLREHLHGLMRDLGDELGQSSENVPARVVEALKAARKGADGAVKKAGASLLLSAEGQQKMDQITAVMSLLEGHANVVMDAVDSSIVPTVKTIRRRFNGRSATQGFLVRFMSKLMNMEAKMRQYRDGQVFVQYVVDQRGMADFNRVWQGPQNLPTLAEIHEPQAWIDRVLGSSDTLGGE